MVIGQPARVDAIFFTARATGTVARSQSRCRRPPLALSLSPGQPAHVAPITAGLPKKSSRRLCQDTASFPSPERRRACGPVRSLKFTSERHCFFFCFFYLGCFSKRAVFVCDLFSFCRSVVLSACLNWAVWPAKCSRASPPAVTPGLALRSPG